MPGSYNGSGIKADSFILVPEGEYTLRIIDTKMGQTKDNDDMVTVSSEIVGGEYNLEKINYYNVIFFKDKSQKGAGFALKFLKSIGEPYEGEFSWDERNWVGKKFKAMIKHETASQGKHAGKTFAKISWVDQCDEGPGGVPSDEVPF